MRRSVKGFGSAALFLFLGAAPARADQGPARRVVLVDLPTSLEDAITAAIVSWDVEVTAAAAESPGPAMPRTAARARALASEHHAQSVVWISRDSSGTALWVYDVEGDRVSSRPLAAEPPYDDPTAAAVALSVKTLLRHSEIAPAEQRFGAAPLETRTAIEPGIAAAAPSVGGLLGLSTRTRATLPAELRLRGGVAYRPWPRIYIMGEAAVGLGRSIAEPEVAGNLSSAAASAAIGVALSRDWLRARVFVAAGLEFTRFSVADPALRVVSRVNPEASTGAWLGLPVGRHLELGAMVAGSLLLRRQRYEVNGVQALTMPRWELELGLGLALWL